MNRVKEKPNFFIIGAQKSGTTSLSTYLKEHPDIYFSTPKEPHFFCEDIANRDFWVPYTNFTNEEYLSFCFPRINEKDYKAIGEASTLYLYSSVAIPNILKYQPNAIFIVMIRNPIEMAQSLHDYMYSSGYEHIRSFEQAWRLQEKRKNGQYLNKQILQHEPRILQYGEMCCLGTQLEKAYNYIQDPEKILVINFDDFKNNTKRTYEETLSFLGVPSDTRRHFPVLNKTKKPYSGWLLRMLKKVGKWKKTIGIQKSFNILGGFKELNYQTQYPRKPLSEYLREELHEYFDPEIDKLCRLTGKDLSYWKNTSDSSE